MANLRGIDLDRLPVERILRGRGYTRVVAAREGWRAASCDCPSCGRGIEHLFSARDERGILVTGLVLFHPEMDDPEVLELAH